MLRLERESKLLHSPITSSAQKAAIDIDGAKLCLMPALPSGGSFKAERQPLLHQEEIRTQPLTARLRTPNHNCLTSDDMSHDHNCRANKNLQCVSFDELSVDDAIISDVLSDYEDSDIDLMQEALLLLVDVKENEELSSDNRCDLHCRSTGTNNHFVKESCFPPNHQNICERIHLPTEQQDNNVNSTIEIEPLNDLHPLLVPQVTFDEEEKFDRRTFFDGEKPLCRRSHNSADIPIVSPSSNNQPSEWLLQQMPSPATSFHRSWSDLRTTDRTPKTRNTMGSKKVDVRASLGTKHKHWSKEEDETLKMATETDPMRPLDWIQIAHDYFNNTRSATQCKNRWKNYLKPGIVRGNWQKQEDEFIVSMVSRGFKWVDIARGLPGRTGEHVRERYVNFLDNKLKKSSWTKEEDRILFDAQRLLGNKWSEIRKLLPGRSDNSIKNRYHNRRNAQLRRLKREASQKNVLSQFKKSKP